MPGVYRRSVDKLVEAAREAADLGIGAMCIFPYTGIEDRTRGVCPARGIRKQCQPRHSCDPQGCAGIWSS